MLKFAVLFLDNRCETGIKAIMVVCDPGKESQCEQEILPWMLKTTELLYPEEETREVEEGGGALATEAPESVSSALEDELRALRGGGYGGTASDPDLRGGPKISRVFDVSAQAKGVVYFQVYDICSLSRT